MAVPIIMLGAAVMQGVSSIMGARAQAAAQRAANDQAHRDWIRSNSQKTMANAREQFQSTIAFTQQMKKNAAISEAAYDYQSEAMQATKTNFMRANRDMSVALRSNQSSLQSAMATRGVSSNSGTHGIMATMQALDAITKSGETQAAYQQEVSNINKQFKGMMSQQTNNIFMPNIQLYDNKPLMSNPGATEAAGMVGGIGQIVGGAAAAFGKTTKSGGGGEDTTTEAKSTVNEHGTDVSQAPKGYTVNSTATQSTLTRTPDLFQAHGWGIRR